MYWQPYAEDTPFARYTLALYFYPTPVALDDLHPAQHETAVEGERDEALQLLVVPDRDTDVGDLHGAISREIRWVAVTATSSPE